MNDWREDIQHSLEAFASVADLAGTPLTPGTLQVEYLEAPHGRPSRLPVGRMAVYGFWGDGGWPKVGMAGPNSSASYCSQHYIAGSAPSTLAASLVGDPRLSAMPGFSREDVGDWLRNSTHRVNILMPSSQPRELLALLEAFLHLRLRPRYER